MKGAFYANGSADTGVNSFNAATMYEGGTSLASKYGAPWSILTSPKRVRMWRVDMRPPGPRPLSKRTTS